MSAGAALAAAARFCDHCGLPVPRAVRGDRAFCCVGCSVAARLVGRAGKDGGSESAAWLARLGLGAVLSMLVMTIAWVEYLDPAAAQSEEYRRFAPWAMLAAATPVLLMLGVPYLYGAVRDLARGRVGADLLIGLGILAAYGASAVAIATGRPGATWLDTAAGLATLVSVGRWLEATAKERAARRLREFLSDAERPAARLAADRGLSDPGEPEAVRASDLAPGDRVLVRPGEKVPGDGVVVEGRALLDEAALTGEPLPRAVGPGDAVAAPAIPADGALVVRVTAVGAGTRLGDVARVLARARAERSPVERLADRVSAVFVPGVVLLAGAVLALDLSRGDAPADAALRALSVLVIACPCALAIATPLAVTAALGRLAERGVLVRTGMALAGLPRVRAVAFDKTGTLTEGRPDVRDVSAPGGDPARALALAAAVEAASEHALGRAIVAAARARGLPALPARDVRVVPGRGVEGVVTPAGAAPVRVRVGSPAWLAEGAAAPSPEPAAPPAGGVRETEVGVEADGRVVATVRLEDRLRPDAVRTVAALRAAGMRVVVLSGDAPEAARSVARALGLPAEEGVGGCLPADKVEALRRLRAEVGGPVAFVGDGLNDAPALAAADLGLAVGSGTDLARETADVSLLGDDLLRLPGLFRAARRTRSAARWNLFWAFSYNVVGLGIAATTHLRPVFAAFAMVASSLLVIANSARLRAVLPSDFDAPPR
jgi:Cu+-exporting ATPase